MLKLLIALYTALGCVFCGVADVGFPDAITLKSAVGCGKGFAATAPDFAPGTVVIVVSPVKAFGAESACHTLLGPGPKPASGMRLRKSSRVVMTEGGNAAKKDQPDTAAPACIGFA